LDNESLAELLNALKGTPIEEVSVEKPLRDLLRELSGDREIEIYHADLKIADNGIVLLTLGYNTIPPSEPHLQFIALDGEGNVVLKRRFYSDSVFAYPELSTDGNVIVLHIPFKYLIAYNSSGERLWIHEASWLGDVLLWWSLSADGRYAAVVVMERGVDISFDERYKPKVALLPQLRLRLVSEGSIVWSRDLREFSTSVTPNVAISPGNKYIAVAQSGEEVDGDLVEEFVRIKLYSIDGEELWSLHSSLGSTLVKSISERIKAISEITASELATRPRVMDLEVLDSGRVLLCTKDKVVSAENGRIVWVKHFSQKLIKCRIARYCGRVLIGDGERIYVLDERGEVVWSIEGSKSGADMSDNCYTLLGSGNRVTLLSPSEEVAQRETLDREAVYVKISPNGRYFLALTRNGVLHIFKSKA